MKEFTTPDFLKDFADLVSEDGLKTSDVWYHGTSSGLVPSIQAKGLIGSGDQDLHNRQLKTLGTIGHQAIDQDEPVFLTQSKELAYFWANAKAHTRSVYLGEEETPVVFEATLPEELTRFVITDAGGAALVLEPGNIYLLWLAELYKENGQQLPELDYKMDRMDYMNRLGLAYSAKDIPAEHLMLLQPN